MNWKFWQGASSGPRPAPQEILNVAGSRMRIPAYESDRLMIVEERGTFAGRQVRFFRVYDPDRLGPLDGPIAYRTLAMKREAVMFEGHSEANHGIVVYDTRARGTGDVTEPAR